VNEREQFAAAAMATKQSPFRRECVRCGRPATHVFRGKRVCATCSERWFPKDYERAEVE
jgi:ribosomal protein L37E